LTSEDPIESRLAVSYAKMPPTQWPINRCGPRGCKESTASA